MLTQILAIGEDFRLGEWVSGPANHWEIFSIAFKNHRVEDGQERMGTKKPRQLYTVGVLFVSVVRAGLEPATPAFSVQCSTN